MGITKEGNKYRARFMQGGKRYNAGTFTSRAKAERALRKKRREVMFSDDFTLHLNDFGLHYEAINNTEEPFINSSKPSLFERVSAKIRSWLKELQS